MTILTREQIDALMAPAPRGHERSLPYGLVDTARAYHDLRDEMLYRARVLDQRGAQGFPVIIPGNLAADAIREGLARVDGGAA